jgi:hypothetical protein
MIQTLPVLLGTLLLVVLTTGNANGQGPSSYVGVWNTVTNTGETFALTLALRSGETLVGHYTSTGVLRGAVRTRVLRFRWQREGVGEGAGKLTFSADGQSFQGTISTNDNPDDPSGGSWSGVRAPSFTGAWRGKFGEGVMETILQQSGDQVTGHLRVNSAELGIVKNGVVVGRIFRFTLVRIVFNGGRGREEYVGAGELTMDNNGTSFSGTILGAKSSGALIGR